MVKISTGGLVVLICLFFSCVTSKDLSGQSSKGKIAAIGFYNVENLFDTIDDTLTLDEEFTPNGLKKWNNDLYEDKLKRIASILNGLGTTHSKDGCAIIGLCEVENRKVLEDLVTQEQISQRYYKIVHFDSPDNRGVDVALLYQSRFFTLLSSKAYPVHLWDGKEEKKTRDVLMVKGKIANENLYVFVNHWPSRRGGESASEPWRISAALVVKRLCDSIQTADPEGLIMIMGDFNDNPNNRSLTEVIEAKKSKEEIQQGAFYNPFFLNFNSGKGTTAHEDSWSLFDQIILSSNLIQGSKTSFKYYKHDIYAKPFMIEKEGIYRDYPKRSFSGNIYNYGYSDHFPVCVYISKLLE